MSNRTEDLADRLRHTHCVLNDLLALWISSHGSDYNTCDDALDALARNRLVNRTLPVTASFANDVERRSRMFAPRDDKPSP